LLWGSTAHSLSAHPVHYEPSCAARAFQGHAVAAGKLAPGSLTTDETFYRLSAVTGAVRGSE
jgi:hypothetical protein